jgi:hypothetical protein
MKFSFFLSSLLLFLSTTFVTSSYAATPLLPQPAIMCVKNIDISTDTTTVTLNNGTSWTYQDIDLFAKPNGWRLGDRVTIVYSYWDKSKYYLQNESYQKALAPVKFKAADYTNHAITTIKNIIPKSDEDGNTLVLEDGTKWFIGSWSSTWMDDWKKGDPVIATPQKFMLGDAKHLIINLKQKQDCVRAQLIYSASSKQSKLKDSNKRSGKNYEVTVSKVWKDASSYLVELSNKTIWKSSKAKKWTAGTKVLIEKDDKSYTLTNLKKDQETKAVFINKDSARITAPTITKVTPWYGYSKAVLSDGSIFLIEADKYESCWEVGNRVIVAPIEGVHLRVHTHNLVNCDAIDQADQLPLCSPAILLY